MLKIACLSAVLALWATAETAVATSYVRGSAVGEIGLKGFEGQTEQADVQASTPGDPEEARGAFHVAHRLANGELHGESWGTVDCLRITDGVAYVTGTIVKGAVEGIGSLRDHRVALTIRDGHPDQLWFDISFLHRDENGEAIRPDLAIRPCQAAWVPIHLSAGDYWLGSA